MSRFSHPGAILPISLVLQTQHLELVITSDFYKSSAVCILNGHVLVI